MKRKKNIRKSKKKKRTRKTLIGTKNKSNAKKPFKSLLLHVTIVFGTIIFITILFELVRNAMNDKNT